MLVIGYSSGWVIAKLIERAVSPPRSFAGVIEMNCVKVKPGVSIPLTATAVPLSETTITTYPEDPIISIVDDSYLRCTGTWQ
jgi:hypothetical protein